MLLDRTLLYGVIGFAAIAVLATGVGFYMVVAPRAGTAPPALAPGAGPSMPVAPPGAASPSAAPSMEVVAERLAARLKANEGTGDDWALLARSYVQMQRYTEAVDAFGKALQKMPGNPAFIEEQAAARKAIAAAASK